MPRWVYRRVPRGRAYYYTALSLRDRSSQGRGVYG